MDDLALSCQVKAALVDQYPDVAVASEYGNVLIYAKGGDRLTQKLRKQVQSLPSEIPGINNLEVHGGAIFPSEAV